jgi:hypothetical protein
MNEESGAKADERKERNGLPQANSTDESTASEVEQAVNSAATGRRRPRWPAPALALLCVAVVAAAGYFGYNARLRGRLAERVEKVREAITGAPTPTPDPYAQAVAKVLEDRGEAVGKQATVEIPEELKQYKEPRRFLAIQEAAAREAGITPPRDFAELARLIESGRELVEVPRLGRGYVLYGVGLVATGELTHYDAKAGKSVPLLAGDDELKAYQDKLKDDRTRLQSEIKDDGDKLKALAKNEKEARAQLLAEVAAKKKELGGLDEKEKLVKQYYSTADARRSLYADYETLASLARDFGGRSYDLGDEAGVKEFQARMLSFARPPALSMIEEVGAAYQEKFGRPLPVTSIIRTLEYQRTLRESGNANAADVSVPPHTTGLAFDIFYHYMTAAEQQFVMDALAQLERDGRIETLRELRDHYHVFVFPEGHRPEESLIEKQIKEMGKGK